MASSHTPLNVGLVGVGGFGAAHLRSIEALENEGKVRLRCVVSTSPAKHAEVKARLDPRGVRWYGSLEEMLQGEADLECAVIPAPIHLHNRMTVAALARGRMVYLEKPPVPLIQQLNDLVTLDARRKVAVAFQQISSPLIRQLKKWKVEGALGRIQALRVRACWPRLTKYYRRSSWAAKLLLGKEPVFDGPATNALAHQIHNLMFLGGEGMDAFGTPVEVEAELYRARPIESYDAACLRGRFESGVEFSAALAHCCETSLGVRLEIFGSKGNAWVADDGKSIGNSLGLPLPSLPQEDPILAAWRDYLEFAQGRRARPPSFLADTRPYVLTTNGMLIASEGIHAIPEAYVRAFGEGDDAGYEAAGLHALVEECGRSGRLFSEQGAPWALKGRSVSLESLETLNLRDYRSR
ncbi:MAG: Gfo/Idh/MocA family oxidoreductase [Verrucomicrobiae bacterium]|nr:Gfo/Idh/MocA family oxidoreductase [Verrucomicrobiae bacterium]